MLVVDTIVGAIWGRQNGQGLMRLYVFGGKAFFVALSP